MITNAKFIAADYDSEAYHIQKLARGTPEYVMSRSDLVLFVACPSAWKNGKEKKDTSATEWGSLMDCLFLTPAAFGQRFAVRPASYQDFVMRCPECQSDTDSNKCKKCGCDRVKTVVTKDWNGLAKVCEKWNQEHDGFTIVSEKSTEGAVVAIDRLKHDQAILDYAGTSRRQVYYTAEWQDPCGVTVPIKILIDLEPDKAHKEFGRTLGDFKTTRDAALGKWARAVHDMNYDMQAAMILDVFNSATGEKRNDFRQILQENVPPYQTAKRVISREFIIGGRVKYQAALEYYALCLKDNHWPDYDWRADTHINGWAVTEQEPWMVKNQPPARPEPEEQTDDVAP